MQKLIPVLVSPWFYIPALSLVAFLLIRLWSGWYSRKVTTALEAIIASHSANPTPPSQAVQQSVDSTLIGEIRRDIGNQTLALAPNDRLPILVNRLADAVVNLKFEAVYRIIFQSQIGFLEILALGARNRAACEAIFAQLVPEATRPAGLTFDAWVRYLSDSHLVIPTADGLIIGRDGQEFLVWKIRMGIPSKP